VRRAVAERWPDLAKSNGGGANAVLSRAPILAHRSVRLRRWPERRVAQIVRLSGGVVVANYHATTRPPLASEELHRLWHEAAAWAGTGPMIVAGDLNLRDPTVPDHDAQHAAQRDVDHVFVRGLRVEGFQRLASTLPGSGAGTVLSDHPPLLVSLGEDR
jgi:endonuclease/exonuclease/phosphatase family metal-dependent hydrolase